MMGNWSLEMMLGCAAVGVVGLAIGKKTPELSRCLIEYKETKKGSRYQSYVFPEWRSWLYAFALATAWVMALYWNSPARAAVISILSVVALVVVYVDNRYRIIANEITVPLMIFGLMFHLATGGLWGVAGSLAAALLGIVVCVSAMFLTRKSGAVGAGDIKLMVAAALVAGFPGVTSLLFFMAAGMGAYCAAGLLLKKLTMKSYFPMGGFIAVGMVLSFFESQLMPVFYRIMG